MWEYKRKDIKFKNYNELTEYLNSEGIEKWEVISYNEEKLEKYVNEIHAKILFKKPKY